MRTLRIPAHIKVLALAVSVCIAVFLGLLVWKSFHRPSAENPGMNVPTLKHQPSLAEDQRQMALRDLADLQQEIAKMKAFGIGMKVKPVPNALDGRSSHSKPI